VDWNDGACVAAGTQFTCFTGTTVQILLAVPALQPRRGTSLLALLVRYKSENTVSEHNRSEVGVDWNDGAVRK
jgi:hypothetical protein